MSECSNIYDKLLYINETKQLIRNALETQGVEITDETTFREYADLIETIQKVSSVNGKTGDVIVEDKLLTIEEYESLTDKDDFTSYLIITD